MYLLELQTQGLVLLKSMLHQPSLGEFPEVLFLSLVDDGENVDDGFANNSDLGELGSCLPDTLTSLGLLKGSSNSSGPK